MNRANVEWRYLPDGRVKHALNKGDDLSAICGTSPWVLSGWCGTGSQVEYETNESLPECKRCIQFLPAPRKEAAHGKEIGP